MRGALPGLEGCVDSEYGKLKAVLLALPDPAMEDPSDPGIVLHRERVTYGRLAREHAMLRWRFSGLGVRVIAVPCSRGEAGGARGYNGYFTRDHFFMTSSGAVAARMAAPVRRTEVAATAEVLVAAGIRVRLAVRAPGTFEGADALWVNPGLVMVGVGKRTNLEGFFQLSRELGKDGIGCERVPAPRASLHLLGAVQFVDRSLALVRTGIVARTVVRFLHANGIRVIPVPENVETAVRQAMNFAVTGPREVLMAEGCPRMKALLESVGIRIVGTCAAGCFADAGGGLACATGIVAREPVEKQLP